MADAPTLQCKSSETDMRSKPDRTSSLASQLVFGERVTALETEAGWAHVRSARDGYEGFVKNSALIPPSFDATHIVKIPWALAYARPDFTSSVTKQLPTASLVCVEENTLSTRPSSPPIRMSRCTNVGWVPTSHLQAISTSEHTVLSAARQFIDTPYLYGGKTARGIGCSALAQLSYLLNGIAIARDTTQQVVDPALQHYPGKTSKKCPDGALIFVPGHVMIASGNGNCIHADGISFRVVEESIDEALRKRNTTLAQATIKVHNVQ